MNKDINGINKQVRRLLDKDEIIVYRTKDLDYWCDIQMGDSYKTFHFYEDDLTMELKILFKKKFDKQLSNSEITLILEELKVVAYMEKLDYNLQSRIFYDPEEKWLYYKLNEENGDCIWIHDGTYELVNLPSQTFKNSNDFAHQIMPTFATTNYSRLPKLLMKHFNVMNEDAAILLAFYLVSSFAGDACLHPILIIYGNMGSGKSQALRHLQQLIDPKKSNLTVLPGSKDDFAIRLYNNYFLALDNLSSLRKEIASLISMVITGGTYTKRELFTNCGEIKIDISNRVLALNGIEVVAKEADVLDRSVLIQMSRFSPEQIKSDKVIMKAFEEDMTQILDICFGIVAKVLIDEEEVIGKKTRLASFFEFSVKAGRIMGLSDERSSEILWNNQKNLNIATLTENTVAQCIRVLMSEQSEFKGSVTELLGTLQEIGTSNNIDKRMLPNSPQYLSRRMNEIKVNLEMEYGILFDVKNIGAFRQITLYKR